MRDQKLTDISEKKERRFEKVDFKTIDEITEFLLGLQQARFDKKNHGVGLTLQELAEYMGATNLLTKIEELQKPQSCQTDVSGSNFPSQYCKDCKNFPCDNHEKHLKCKNCVFRGNQQSNFQSKSV